MNCETMPNYNTYTQMLDTTDYSTTSTASCYNNINILHCHSAWIIQLYKGIESKWGTAVYND